MAALLAFIPMIPQNADPAYAAEGLCGVIKGDNSEDQDYGRWSEPVRSYLIKEGSQLMRVQASEDEAGKFQATYYDASTYKAVSRKTVNTDLPIFGGFATDGNYYYVVTGQNNTSSSDSVEVFRVQKYDKNWNSLGYDSLYGANTMYPFDAGSCRFAFTGNYMAVRTAHEMYSGHQANVTILFNTSSATITDSQYDVSNIGRGYVSHSFNQFVVLNGGKIVALDHGDAYPRSIVLCEYPTNVTSGKFNSSSVTSTDVLTFEGSIGNNSTGATVGAFEMNSSNYLVAYNTVKRDSDFESYDTHNIYVAVIDKSSKSITRRQFTYYDEGSGDTSTPHMVNIGGSYLLLWNERNEIFCNKITASGVKVDDANTSLGYGYLSDCKPFYDSSTNKVIWYDFNDGEEEFYEINLNTMKLNSYSHKYEHNHVYDSTSGGYATMKCTECGDTYEMLVPTDFTAKWKGNTSAYSEEMPKISYATTLYYDFSLTYAEYNYSMGRLSDMILESNDKVNCHVDADKKSITFDKTGTYSFTAYPKYNPTLKKTYSITVGTPLSKVTISADKTIVKPGETIKLSAVSEGGSSEIVYSFHAYISYGSYDSYYQTIRSAESANTCEWTPQSTGTYIVQVDAQDVGGDWSEAEDRVTIKVSNSTDSEDEDDSGISLVKYASVGKVSNKTYTGKDIMPEPTVQCFGVSLVKGRDYELSYSNNRSVGIGQITIKGIHTYSGTITKTFKIIPKKTAVKSTTTAYKTAITVKWNKISTRMTAKRINGYQVQIARNKAFTKGKKSSTVTGYKKTYLKFKGLKRKTSYYVRVRTYMKVGNSAYYSKWSKVKKIKTK